VGNLDTPEMPQITYNRNLHLLPRSKNSWNYISTPQ